MKRKYILITCLSLFFIGCDRTSTVEPADNNSMVAVFDTFYTAMDERYVFWDLDTATNWEEIQSYRNQFEQLDINSTTDRVIATELFREITSTLIDHHYSISFQAAGITGVSINPARERKIEQGILQSNNSYPEVLAALQQPRYDITFDQNTRFVTGMLNANTLFFKVNQFRFVRNQSNEALQSALDWFIAQANSGSVEHVVLDLRSCVGGDLVDLQRIMGNLVSQDITFGSTKYKQGRAPLQYSPLIPATLVSNRQNREQILHILVLTDTQTASLAELIAYIIQSNQLGEVIGQNTYGAFSPISDASIFYSGDIDVTGFMTIRTSSVQFLGINNVSLEGKGVPPDVSTSQPMAALVDYLD